MEWVILLNTQKMEKCFNSYCICNHRLSSGKGLQMSINDCVIHDLIAAKLAMTIKTAKSENGSLAIAWLDMPMKVFITC